MPYVLLVIVLLFWFSSFEPNRKASFNAGLAVILALALSYLLGLVYYHNRPFVDFAVTQLLAHEADASFPSDHTTFIFAIAASYVFNASTRTLGLFLSLVCLVSGMARVFAGVHYPFDILGGLLLGFMSAAIIAGLQPTKVWQLAYGCFAWFRLPKR